jgi:hypothetical protein
MRLTRVFASAAVAGAMAAGAFGLSAATATATPLNPPSGYGDPDQPGQPPAPPAGPQPGTAPASAPPKPVDPAWANGQKQVWDQGWQHWGVWMNGVFIPTY